MCVCCVGVMPKRGLNVSICEVFRFYRLVAVRDLLEPLSFCVPRKVKTQINTQLTSDLIEPYSI